MSQSPKSGPPNPREERASTVIETDEDVRRALQAGLKPPIPGVTGEPFQRVPLPSRPSPPHPHEERSGTLLETDEDVRRALQSGLKGQPLSAPSPSASPSPRSRAANASSPFRPTVRPSVAVLTVYDDGKADGEVIRIREPRFVIGRVEGDLRIPIDGRMSSRHVEIALQNVGGQFRWVVSDLQSMHGMFVRVSKTALADRAEFLVGNGRYRFEAAQGESDQTADYGSNDSDFSATQGWADGPGPLRPPALTELIGNEIGNRILLVKPEYWIGTDPTCPICRSDDPFCESRHLRLARNSRGGWFAEHNKTQNGLWLRMAQITVEATVYFQIGEQRFRIKVG